MRTPRPKWIFKVEFWDKYKRESLVEYFTSLRQAIDRSEYLFRVKHLNVEVLTIKKGARDDEF